MHEKQKHQGQLHFRQMMQEKQQQQDQLHFLIFSILSWVQSNNVTWDVIQSLKENNEEKKKKQWKSLPYNENKNTN